MSDRSLRGVASDLWRVPAPATSADKPASAPAPASLDPLWRAMDDPVDWTEILANPAPTDGLTSPERWTAYRRYAPGVLSGDTKTYLAVLKVMDPLADLTAWAESFDTVCVDSERLRVTARAKAELLALRNDYPEGLALRIARDLFALLPVTAVEVCILGPGGPVLEKIFTPRDAR